MTKPHEPVETTLDPNGLIVLTFSGDLDAEQITAFKSSLDIAAIAIAHQFNAKKTKVKILLDMRNFTGKYNAEAIGALAEFAKHNTPYVEKTASFGGSAVVKIAGEVVLSLAGRDNIKIFSTKEEALAWLEQ